MKIKPKIYVLYENGIVTMCTTSRHKMERVLYKKIKSGELHFKKDNVDTPINRLKSLLQVMTFIEF